jgi:putative membrane-bound dehydrogenase-like protein
LLLPRDRQENSRQIHPMRKCCRFALAVLSLNAIATAAEFKFEPHTFSVPDGYTVERVAASPLVDRPITMAFDETGALYVADSSGSNEKPDVQLKNPTHRIVRLVDRDGDGVFDSNTVYADKLAFPEGTMWLDGSLYVAAPPQIWKFTDINSDGVADKREVWFDGKTLTGCANDLHGPYAGPDGFIYWCKGAFAEQKHMLADGRKFVTRASHVFRMRPDGSGLDVVMTGGMDNPVDIAFSASGEMFVSGTFFVQPAGGKRDGILHAVHGGVWGKEHGVLDGHPRTGDLMPIMTHVGPAAASGLEMLRSEALGMRGDLVCCQFNLRKISRHVLEPDGATYKTSDTDLLVSDQVDFHPTDIVEDADGSLLIADTGGWYRLCCPTSTLAKPAVLGAIYRIRKKDQPVVEDSRGLKIDWKKADAATLTGFLEDSRPVVVDRAMESLARRKEVAALRASVEEGGVAARLNSVWILARIPGDEARAAVRIALDDTDPRVRALATRTVALWRDREASDSLISLLADSDAGVRRGSVAALGQLGEPRAIRHLLKAGESRPDRFLQHALAYALFEIGDEAALPADLKSPAGDLARTARAMIGSRGPVKSVAPLPAATVPAPVPLDPAVAARQRARLDELATHLKNADARRGAEIYRSAKAICTTCHAMSNVGGTLGPDLTRIGAIRVERDLLEAIVYPSASFVRSYEPALVKTKNGDQLGILKKEAADEIVLANGPGSEVHIPRAEIISAQPGTMSLMPQGFDGMLTPQEIADLVAFLRTAK